MASVTKAEAAGWVDRLRYAVEEDAAIGRKLLVVIGSGCSVPCCLPTMPDIFKYLRQELSQRAALGSDVASTSAIRLLSEDLDTLVKVGGPRSVAARALRVLQRAEVDVQTAFDEEGSAQQAVELCKELWQSFALAFIKGEIRRSDDKRLIMHRDPTEFHRCIARLVVNRVAVPLSLNFDGFTRKAIDRTGTGRCVILNEPDQLRAFMCAGSHGFETPVPYVIKVWGDVFHAVCHNPFCPQFEVPVPLYTVQAPNHLHLAGGLFADKDASSSAEGALECPDCGNARQLRIYFAGYQEKELGTEKLVEELERFVAPRVGCILIAGFSGEWDTSLMKFLLRLARRCQEDAQEQTRVFCVDPKQTKTYAQQAMEAIGVKVEQATVCADEVASLLISAPPSRTAIEEVTEIGHEDWTFWRSLLQDSGHAAQAQLPSWCKDNWSQKFTSTLGQLRQLGIKTRLLRPDHEHTRKHHSVGCATLAWYWHTELEKKGLEQWRDYPRSMTMLAAALHDMGHLPFSHLTEEVMDELRWTIPGAHSFRHDANAFSAAWTHVCHAAMELLNSEVTPSEANKAQMRLTRLVEGRSGVPGLTAMLNSPIDVDKIDYLFRDCFMLKRSIHLPAMGSEAERAAWFRGFVEDQIVLPSGLVALYGKAGEKARELLEERWYLYRNVYFHPAFRSVEKIVRAVLTFWLCRTIPKMRAPIQGQHDQTDPRSDNGALARRLLWGCLTDADETIKPPLTQGGESQLIKRICDWILCSEPATAENESRRRGIWRTLPPVEPVLEGREREWFERCRDVLTKLLLRTDGDRTMDQVEAAVRREITLSPPLFVSRSDYKTKVSDIIRVLEYDHPFTALIDAALMPRMLSYASQRGTDVVAECYVVPRADPDHWGQRPPARWCPLSKSSFAERDERRQVQLLVVSPRGGDYNTVGHVMDRLQNACRNEGVEIAERMQT